MRASRVVVCLTAIVFTMLLAHRTSAGDFPAVCRVDAECNDLNACTENHCNTTTGACEFPFIDCNDNDACTTDSCDETLGCQYTVVECNDGNACTDDTCDSTYGCRTEPTDCDDLDPCTNDFCDGTTGCGHVYACDDNDACTIDTCTATGCHHEPASCDDGNPCTTDYCDDRDGCLTQNVECTAPNACTTNTCDQATGQCVTEPVLCDDHDACTVDTCDLEEGCRHETITCDDFNACTDDHCGAGTGCFYTLTDCDDGDPCTPESCDDELGCASGPPIDCDDHDACTADSCDAAGACTHTPVPGCGAPPALDHFLCYESQRPMLDRKGVSVVDEFGTSTVTVKRPNRLCAPADKNHENPGAVSAPGNLTAYTLRQTAPRFRGAKGVHVQNQFGTLTVDLDRPERMLVPTAQSLTGAPEPLTASLDHFACYRVRRARFRLKGVTVETTLGSETVDIKRPRHLCVPADKNGETPGAEDHAIRLMCYQVRSKTKRPQAAFTSNQFGADQYDVFGVRELCVPSIENPGTCGNGAVDALGETCDPPGAVCASDGRVCGASCTCPTPACGDGVVNQASEQCDDGNTASGDGCSPTCTTETPVCGNDVREGNEECDGTADGNCTGACHDCVCLVSQVNCPLPWTFVNDADGGFCGLSCGAANPCPAPFTCSNGGYCLNPCTGASPFPVCGGDECPGGKLCAAFDALCYCAYPS